MARPSGANRPSSRQLIGSSTERNTSNNHFARLVDATDETFDVLLLESPLKPFGKSILTLPRLKVSWCRSRITDLKAIQYSIICFPLLFRSAAAMRRYGSISFKNIMMCLLRYLRGKSNAQYLRELRPSRIVFTLSGNACTSIIELELKGSTSTIHWLHGIGLGFAFESFAEWTLVNNQFDRDSYNGGISGASLFFPDEAPSFDVPRRLSDVDDIVIYSNLVHRDNEWFQQLGFSVERELLTLVAQRTSRTRLWLKPHPTSGSLLGKWQDDYSEMVSGLGFTLLTEADDFATDSTIYISTISTSYIDLISRGRCVFLYEKYGNRDSGFFEYISQDLRFADGETMDQTFELLENSDRLIEELSRFVVQSEKRLFDYSEA